MPMALGEQHYQFMKNDPYERTASIQLVIPPLLPSRDYMNSIRNFAVPADTLAVWYLGQNGFLLKDSVSPLIGIDLYLTNSCASTFAHLPFRLDRQLPIFIEPEDLDIDIFITTHSHDDHADPETIRRMVRKETTLFVGPFNSVWVYARCGVPKTCSRLLHPGQSLKVDTTTLQATFALPTDATDLNHSGMLITFASGITFYNTGDTAWAERLPKLLPSSSIDICAICMNGGFYNLTPTQAAAVVKELNPRVVVPCHYDMMINNVCSPQMLRVALDQIGTEGTFTVLPYYEPWLYRRGQPEPVDAVQVA